MKYNATLSQDLARLAELLRTLIGRTYPYDALITSHGKAVEMTITGVNVYNDVHGHPWCVTLRNDLRFADGYVADCTMDGGAFYECYYNQL